ncbi:MAG: transposase [Chlorobi bacterium]|nr:transposase [Chlorobiota bacterium]
MSTFTQFLYQIVFSTKYQERSMIESGQKMLYKYIWGILKNKNCHLYRIGGVENHIHIVTHIHQSVAIANLIKDIKLASGEYIKNEKIFPDFSGWQDGYGAFTYHISAKNNLIEYVKNQKEHHRKISFREEYISLLKEHQIEFDEKYLL